MNTSRTNPNWDRRYHNQKPMGHCRHCGEQLWANTDRSAHLAGTCIPSREEATVEILALFAANLAAGLIDQATHDAAVAALATAR